MTVAESYTSHRPVIAGNIGNIGALVDEEIAELCFDYNSAEALKNALLRFGSMSMEAMEENTYRKYEVEFMLERNYSVLKRIYDTITNG
ncbi:hypothetical protein [Frisingicoccus sp.]|uniref:hypothetical protein n=1 Tax=Frisingicoccus sp. TaxID=1918627 RepID=UPI003AB4A3AC